MEAKHTPGPWTVQELERNRNGYQGWHTYCVRHASNVHLATIGHVDRYGCERNAANARLIAAAPDLLAALAKLLALAEAEGIGSEWEASEAAVGTARAAVAKATGRG